MNESEELKNGPTEPLPEKLPLALTYKEMLATGIFILFLLAVLIMAGLYANAGLNEYYQYEGVIKGAKLCVQQVQQNNHYGQMIAPECDRPISDYLYINFSSMKILIPKNS